MSKMTNITESSRFSTYQFDDDPVVIHIIKTGFHNKYFIISEDGYESPENGKTQIMTREKIKETFNISVD